MRIPLSWLRAFVLAVVVGVVGLSGISAAQERDAGTLRNLLSDLLRNDGTSQGETPENQRRVPFSRDEIQLSFAPLVKETAPVVVNVHASSKVQVRSPFMGDPFFEQFFGRRQLPPRVRSSLGSGVLVGEDGIVVTNNHVIQDADEVKVALADGREFQSEILLSDEAFDLAVLKIRGMMRSLRCRLAIVILCRWAI